MLWKLKTKGLGIFQGAMNIGVWPMVLTCSAAATSSTIICLDFLFDGQSQVDIAHAHMMLHRATAQQTHDKEAHVTVCVHECYSSWFAGPVKASSHRSLRTDAEYVGLPTLLFVLNSSILVHAYVLAATSTKLLTKTHNSFQTQTQHGPPDVPSFVALATAAAKAASSASSASGE